MEKNNQATYLLRSLEISPSTAQRIFVQFLENGEVEPKGNKGPRTCRRKLDDQEELFIVGLILEEPSMYLKELCEKVSEVCGVDVCESTICKILHRHGFTRKKIRQVALQRSAELRGEFMSQALLYKKEMFVWVDESGCDNRTYMRKYGYAIKGDTPLCHRFLARGQRVSAIAAISTDGVVCLELSTQTVDSDMFYDFIRGNLIPQMARFDGINLKSIVILDNCTVHHVEEVESMLRDAGIAVLFLPPYSPDYNPIEEAFSYVKYYLKKHDNILQLLSMFYHRECLKLNDPIHSGL